MKSQINQNNTKQKTTLGEKELRLKAALKANMAKRKAQAKARNADGSGAEQKGS